MVLELAAIFAQQHTRYIGDFKAVWEATRFLERRPPTPTNADLDFAAKELAKALRSWGADSNRRNNAATLLPEPDIAHALGDPVLLSILAELRAEQAQVLTGPLPDTYHDCARWAIDFLGTFMLAGNNSTLVYPAKALMLLTGVGPAPDSHVRRAVDVLGWPEWAPPENYLRPMCGGNCEQLFELWRSAGELIRAEHAQLELAIEQSEEVRWIADQGAYGRVVDMALFVFGHPMAGAQRSGPLHQPPPAGNWVAMATWARQAPFRFRARQDGGFDLEFGQAQSRTIDGAQLRVLLNTFKGRTVLTGTSHTNPPAGSLGAWLLTNLGGASTASYFAPVLEHMGYAARVPDDTSRIRFK